MPLFEKIVSKYSPWSYTESFEQSENNRFREPSVHTSMDIAFKPGVLQEYEVDLEKGVLVTSRSSDHTKPSATFRALWPLSSTQAHIPIPKLQSVPLQYLNEQWPRATVFTVVRPPPLSSISTS